MALESRFMEGFGIKIVCAEYFFICPFHLLSRANFMLRRFGHRNEIAVIGTDLRKCRQKKSR